MGRRFDRYEFDKPYDLIMSHGVLYFVEKEQWKEFIRKAKNNTNIGGLNIMQIFTNRVPVSPDIAPYVQGLADWPIPDFPDTGKLEYNKPVGGIRNDKKGKAV